MDDEIGERGKDADAEKVQEFIVDGDAGSQRGEADDEEEGGPYGEEGEDGGAYVEWDCRKGRAVGEEGMHGW